jgi:hypothetical protein
MSKQKPRRQKPYRPRHVQTDPVSWAIAGVHTLPLESQQATMKPVDAAVLLLKQGKSTREDWNVVCQALNIAEELAKLQIGSNLLPQILAGQQALRSVAFRMIGKGSATCYGAELVAIDEALTMYRAQLRLCAQAEFGRAVNRVKQLHASGAMDDVGRMYEQMQKAA